MYHPSRTSEAAAFHLCHVSLQLVFNWCDSASNDTGAQTGVFFSPHVLLMSDTSVSQLRIKMFWKVSLSLGDIKRFTKSPAWTKSLSESVDGAGGSLYVCGAAPTRHAVSEWLACTVQDLLVWIHTFFVQSMSHSPSPIFSNRGTLLNKWRASALESGWVDALVMVSVCSLFLWVEFLVYITCVCFPVLLWVSS